MEWMQLRQYFENTFAMLSLRFFHLISTSCTFNRYMIMNRDYFIQCSLAFVIKV
jgi:hypothetical protein